jgi:hypothetical protein
MYSPVMHMGGGGERAPARKSPRPADVRQKPEGQGASPVKKKTKKKEHAAKKVLGQSKLNFS